MRFSPGSYKFVGANIKTDSEGASVTVYIVENASIHARVYGD